MTDSSYEVNKGARVLKTDVLGRVQTSAAQREAMLHEFERSGLCGTKFAAVAGVNYQTFASWVQKRRRATGAYTNSSRKPATKKTTVRSVPALPALGWVEAVVEEAAESVAKKAVLRLDLPGGASVLIADEAQAALAAALLKRLQHQTAGVSC
jgi:hypothetical protein